MADPSFSARIAGLALETPALVYDGHALRASAEEYARLGARLGIDVLCAQKAFGFGDLVAAVVPPLAGVAVSSEYEARIARAAIGPRGFVHLTSPGLRDDASDWIGELVDRVSFNSLSQLERLGARLSSRVSAGVRVNPGLSLVSDPRIDPCRQHSKLGAPVAAIREAIERDAAWLSTVDGIHIHTNCESGDYAGLDQTVRLLVESLSPLLGRVDWINLGGGYFYPDQEQEAVLRGALGRLAGVTDAAVSIEPGTGLVREAGYIVATVVDLFVNDGRSVAVVDTSVNHMPEVFEYHDSPDVHGDDDAAPHTYELAGCTCLPGDTFGYYGFQAPLRIGARLVFEGAGAYTFVKAHTFNGVPLPAVYRLEPAGEPRLLHQADFAGFDRIWGR